MKTLILASAAAIALFVSGCGATRASITKTVEWSGPASSHVEVLLDSQPAKPFEVVAELSADAIESPHSIKMMKEEAARQGLDGIYWIECADGRGVCRARGFVYTAFDSASASAKNDSSMR